MPRATWTESASGGGGAGATATRAAVANRRHVITGALISTDGATAAALEASITGPSEAIAIMLPDNETVYLDFGDGVEVASENTAAVLASAAPGGTTAVRLTLFGYTI